MILHPLQLLQGRRIVFVFVEDMFGGKRGHHLVDVASQLRQTLAHLVGGEEGRHGDVAVRFESFAFCHIIKG